MSIAWKKRWMWALLYTGGAGTLLFFYLCITLGPPPSINWWIWPVIGLLCSLFSVLKLRQYHRLEPAQYLHKPQLSLIDLWALAGFAGLFMAAWMWKFPNSFETRGVIVCVLTAVGLLGGILLASRRGMSGYASRWIFAMGFALTIAGGMGIGALITLIVGMSIGEVQSPLAIIMDVISRSNYTNRGMELFLLSSLLILPLGLGLCALARWIHEQKKQGAESKPEGS